MNELLLLQTRIDDHIKECEMNRIADEKKWAQLLQAQHANTAAIGELTESTKALVSFWTAADGTIRTMSTVGRFVRWMGGFAVVVVIYQYFTEAQ